MTNGSWMILKMGDYQEEVQYLSQKFEVEILNVQNYQNASRACQKCPKTSHILNSMCHVANWPGLFNHSSLMMLHEI